MTDDLVQRLRDRGVCSIAQNSCRNDYACAEAADRIEALQADNARLRKALIKIDTLDGIGGPDGEVQCANIARAALQETER